MDDVARGDEEFDLFARRDDHLTRGDDVGGRKVAGVAEPVGIDVLVEVVAELPPPLLTNDDDLGFPVGGLAADLDLDGVGLGVVDREVGDGRHDGDDDHDDRRHTGHEDLEAGVMRLLLGELVVALVGVDPVLDREPHDGGTDEDQDDAGDEQHRVEEIVDLPGGVALRLEGVELGITGTASRDEADEGDQPEQTGTGFTHCGPLLLDLHRGVRIHAHRRRRRGCRR